MSLRNACGISPEHQALAEIHNQIINSCSFIQLEFKRVVFRALSAVVAAYTGALDFLLVTHVVRPDVDAVGAEVAVGAELDAVGLDEVVAAAVVVAVSVLAHDWIVNVLVV